MDEKTEKEIKIDVPPRFSDEEIIKAIGCVWSNQSVRVISDKKTVSRVFVYYDTNDDEMLKSGSTLRRVSGFNPEAKDGKTKYRYDYKCGKVESEERKEESVWSDAPLTLYEISERFCKNQKPVAEVATAHTTHHKWKIGRFGAILEISFDIFACDSDFKNIMFREIEIEAIQGEIDDCNNLTHLLLRENYAQKNEAHKIFEDFYIRNRRVKLQKYERVRGALSKYEINSVLIDELVKTATENPEISLAIAMLRTSKLFKGDINLGICLLALQIQELVNDKELVAKIPEKIVEQAKKISERKRDNSSASDLLPLEMLCILLEIAALIYKRGTWFELKEYRARFLADILKAVEAHFGELGIVMTIARSYK